MRIIMEDVPIYLHKPVISKVGKALKFGQNHVLVDKNRHRTTIDYNRLDRAMCSPNEVNRALQVIIIYWIFSCK